MIKSLIGIPRAEFIAGLAFELHSRNSARKPFLSLELAMQPSQGAYLTTRPLPLSWHWHTLTQVILTQAISSDL